MKITKYENYVIQKPWGSEYVIFKNDKLSITFLDIKYLEKTSLHCHPTKKTGLIVISGSAEITLGFYNSETFTAPAKTMIRPGFFHSTQAISKKGVKMLEIETPSNKDDIVRFMDNYGREGKKYIADSKKTKIKNKVIFKNPEFGKTKSYFFDGVELKIEKYKNLKKIINKSLDTIIAVIDGGIRCKKTKRLVLTPGEVVKTGTIIKLDSFFEIDEFISIISITRIN